MALPGLINIQVNNKKINQITYTKKKFKKIQMAPAWQCLKIYMNDQQELNYSKKFWRSMEACRQITS